MRNTVFKALTAGWLIAPSAVYCDPINVVLIPTSISATDEISSEQLYLELGGELKRSLALQGVVLLGLRDLGMANDVFSSLNTTAFSEFAMRRLTGKDYAISLALTASVKRTAISRVANLRAEGAVVDISNGEVLTTYSVDAPESVMLPLSVADCNATCAELKLTDAKAGLGRELSFVLTQKMHFLQEDGVIPKVSDPVAIADRLKPTGDRPTSVEIVLDNGDLYTIDAARSLDIEVYFDPNSDQLTYLAQNQLAALGQALQDEALFEAQYLIVGHTDATGAAEYNLALSERRAARVREYLIETYAVTAHRLQSIGLGEAQLKEPSKPDWGVNRRVEIALLVDSPTRTSDATELTEYTLVFNLFERGDAVRVARELEQALKTVAALELSNTTQRIYVLKSKQTTATIEQVMFLALQSAGLAEKSVRVSVSGQKITLDKL